MLKARMRDAGTESVTPLPDLPITIAATASKFSTLPATGLFVLAIFYTLFFASEFFLPIVLALLVSLLLLPCVRLLRKIGIPESLGAAVTIILLVIVLLGLGSLVIQPSAAFLSDFPTYAAKIRDRISGLSGPLTQLAEISKQIDQMTTANQSPGMLVTLKQQGVLQILFSQTPAIFAKIIVVVVLSYFLLTHGEVLLRKTVRVLPTFEDKRRVVEIAREIEISLSRYLVSVTILNLALGFCVGLAAGVLELHNPLMWGGIAFLLNYVPFIGSACGIFLIGIASLVQFDQVWYACIPPFAYLVLNALESNFVTPHVLGRWMTLNLIAIIISFLFWGWLWGVPGMLLAVPILASTKIICDHIVKLAPFGEFLGA
jgi:predicted PurR-regulated permease PerM